MLFWYQAIFLVTIPMTVEVLVSWTTRSLHVQELTTLGGDAEPRYKVTEPRETKGESRMKCMVKSKLEEGKRASYFSLVKIF